MEKILESHKLSKVTKKEKAQLKNPIELVQTDFNKEEPDQDGYTAEFY